MTSSTLDDPTDLEPLTQPGSIPRIEIQPRLVQLCGSRGEVGRVLLLDRALVVIGRGAGVDLVVHDNGVSRRHAAVERLEQGYRLIDYDSRNGTFVNNLRVKDAVLREGDRIQLGSTTLLRFSSLGRDDEWLHQSLDHGTVALWEYSVGTGQVTWSEHADRALHLSAGTLSLRRMPLHTMVHPDDVSRVTAGLRLTTEEDQPFEQEFRLLVGPESVRWVLGRAHVLRAASGSPTRVAGTAIDISDRKRRELELRRMAVIFESLSDASFLTDAEGMVVDLNSAAQRLFDLTKPDTLGKPLLETLGASNAAELQLEVQRALKAAGRWGVELGIAHAGAERSFDVSAFPLRYDDNVLGTAFLFRDITERKQLQSQLAFYDRLSALGTLSAGIAHEINNPLAFVLSNLEFAIEEQLDRGSPHQPELDALQDALQGARRIASTVRDMKALSRDDAASRPVPTDARGPLEMAVKMTQKLMATRGTLSQELADDLPLVSANESRLSQVFINLLVNAAQAIPEGKQGHITVRQSLVGDFVVTEVADDGVGIPQDQLQRIFDPFFTTKPVGVGTGLGLSICQGLVMGFGGTLTVSSEPGRGTTFTVKLPVSREATKTPSAVQRGKARRGRLLLIDDEPLMLRSMMRTLGAAHDVSIASGADEGLALVEQGDFDVIFCDVMMPQRTGIDFYEQLDRDHPELSDRVVFISGEAFTERARDFLARVENTTLNKPFDAAAILGLVQERLRDRTGNHAAALEYP